jgi:cold shock CspA family protein
MDTGKIVRFDPEKGYGFIRPDGGGDDLFVHTNDLFFEKAEARPGVHVRYNAEEGDRGAKASEVELVDPVVHHESEPRAAGPAGPAADGGDILTEQEFLAEVTEGLLACSPTLTGAQIVEIRAALLRAADQHGWIGD